MNAITTMAEVAAEPVPQEIPEEAAASASAAALPSAFADMHLNVGDQLHLEPPRWVAHERLTVNLLGWLDGVSLIISAPQKSGQRVVLQVDDMVVLRGFNGRNAFAFSAAVTNVSRRPFAHLHVSFPDKVECVAVRSSPRCRVRLPARITAGGAVVEASILNIGTAGALIESANPLGEDAGAVRIAFSHKLHGVPVSFDLQATVCGAKSAAPPAESAGAAGAAGAPVYQYGVEFTDLQPNDQLMLGSLVWYTLHENPRSAI